jgi:hypothetical protein
MKQNEQNRTYITIRIYKHNNKNTSFTKLQTEAYKAYNIYIKWKKIEEKA